MRDARQAVAQEIAGIKELTIDIGQFPISPTETMHWQGDDSNYYFHAKSAIRLIEASLLLANSPEVRTILDFPCGHGRVQRGLRAQYPKAEIVAADLDRRGVEFCANVFGAVPFLSHTDLRRITFEQTFDLIWVGSLFTHVKAEQWPEFIDLFVRSLSIGGVLVFTYASDYVAWLCAEHGDADGACDRADVEQALKGFRNDGFGFMPYRGRQDYGRSLARTTWVQRLIAERYSQYRLVLHSERAWGGRQNAVAIARNPVEHSISQALSSVR